MYNVPYAESDARFREALDIILRAWKGDPFSHHGEFYRFENVTVAPRPYQLPHPPLRMAAATEETFARVGQMGLPLFVGLRGMDIPGLVTPLAAYRKAWREASCPGEPNVYVRIPVYAGRTQANAQEEARESTLASFERQANLARAAVGRAGTGPAERVQARADRLATISYDDVLRTKVAYGSAEGLVDRLAELREELGLKGIVA